MGIPLDQLNPKQRQMVEAALNGQPAKAKVGEPAGRPVVARKGAQEAGKAVLRGIAAAPVLIADCGGVFIASLPIKTVSETNQHTHWTVRSRRVKAQRQAVSDALREALSGRGNPRHIFLVRKAARTLDVGDNLQSAMKGVRDEIADILGFDDRDQSVEWHVSQLQESKGASVFVVIKW